MAPITVKESGLHALGAMCDNWMSHKMNSQWNVPVTSHFDCAVFNYGCLPRDGGLSGSIDLGPASRTSCDRVAIAESPNLGNVGTLGEAANRVLAAQCV